MLDMVVLLRESGPPYGVKRKQEVAQAVAECEEEVMEVVWQPKAGRSRDEHQTPGGSRRERLKPPRLSPKILPCSGATRCVSCCP